MQEQDELQQWNDELVNLIGDITIRFIDLNEDTQKLIKAGPICGREPGELHVADIFVVDDGRASLYIVFELWDWEGKDGGEGSLWSFPIDTARAIYRDLWIKLV